MKKLGKHGGRLILRNLPFSLDEKALREMLEKIGEIVDLKLPWEEAKKRNKGFAFVEFEKKNISEKAIKLLNNKKIQNRQISIDYSLSKDKYNQALKQEELNKEFKPHKEPEEEKKEEEAPKPKPNRLDKGKCLFIQNLSFDTEEESLQEFFSQFGKLKSANLVLDKDTGESKGTAFVTYKSQEDAEKALAKSKEEEGLVLDDRKLNIMIAVSREEAAKIKSAKPAKVDKRNLALSKEGIIMPNSEEFSTLTKEDIERRTRAAQTKKEKLMNPNIFVSQTRLVIRNLPKAVDEKKLKNALKQILIKNNPELENKKLFTQIKIKRDKDKLDSHGNAISRGFGFVECKEHEYALTCLRGLNNNDKIFGKGKKPIVEFALEDHRMIRLRKLKLARQQKLKEELKTKLKTEEKEEKSTKMGRGKRQRMKRKMMKEARETEKIEENEVFVEKENKVSKSEGKKKKDASSEKPTKRKRKDDFEIEMIEFEDSPSKRRVKKDSKKSEELKLENLISEYRAKLFNGIEDD
ncbi:unnamed protein product [Blepharisma stoltei]|uniref:RRM domain-containing protein n=1 Tax=Blepharisma stoltei TaxID=1481888 RepID=A0AAU9KLX1_9CILI|nr:unnamed protein product [Blepharisma stoltei]